MLQASSPSKHNAMLGKKVAHPSSTNFEGSDEFERQPVKRVKRENDARSPVKAFFGSSRENRVVDDSDEDEDAVDLAAAISRPVERQTGLETALPPLRTDQEAIDEYETARASAVTEELDAGGRLEARKWVRGKSSIYVDAFNLALDTVLEDESHLFNSAEIKLFNDWRNLAYETQYLYVRLFLRKTSSWHRINKLGYYSDVSNMETAISDLQQARDLPTHDADQDDCKTPGEHDRPDHTFLEQTYVFADRSEECITTLEEASSLLLLDELKAIAKDAKVQGKNKSDLLKALRRSSRKQTGLGFLKRSDTEESIVSTGSRSEDPDSGASTPLSGENMDFHYVSKIMAETGPCIRLSLPVLKLFERVHLVFYRSTEWTEKSLTTIILARISKRNFPQYLVSRSANIFSSRALLLEFEASIRTQFKVDNILEFNGPPTPEALQDILDMTDEILPRWQDLLREEQRKEDRIYSTGEGAYLRRLSPAWVYTRIIHKGAFVLGKLKHHYREHTILSQLLEQTLFHTSRRGDWYQRKALLEEHYMGALTDANNRSPEAQKKYWKRIALETCEIGLQDPLTHHIFHHDLQKRVVKLEKALKVPKRDQHDFGHVRLAKPAERYFSGTQILSPDPTPVFRRGAKTVWIDPALPEDSGATCSVEEMCLSRYRAQGWRGFHCESSMVRTLFAVLFNDVIFTYVPNVFQTQFQTCPLDLHTDAFYPARISEINARLNEIGNGRAESIAQEFYAEHEERKTCVVGMNWDFDKQDVLDVIRAWDPGALATVLKVLVQEYGARGGGVPDLFLWREFDPLTMRTIMYKDENELDKDLDQKKQLVPEEAESEPLDEAEKKRRAAILATGRTGEVCFSEVKSENDRLSDTQRMWIHVLTGAGVPVELCHAVAETVRER